MVEVVVERRVAVDLAARTAARTHSNMVKQRGRVRAALCEDLRLDQLMAATRRICMSLVLELGKAAAQKIEWRHPIFFAVPAVPVVGLGLCCVAAAQPTILGSRERPDGRDGPPRT